MNSHRSFLPVILIAALFFLQSACSSHRVIKDNRSREALLERVEQLWQARMDGNREALYALADHRYRETVSLQAFNKLPVLDVKKFTILDVNISGNEAFAEVTFEMDRMGIVLNLKTWERWLFEQGEWYEDFSGSIEKSPFGPIPMK
jgi:hypothetical protein